MLSRLFSIFSGFFLLPLFQSISAYFVNRFLSFRSRLCFTSFIIPPHSVGLQLAFFSIEFSSGSSPSRFYHAIFLKMELFVPEDIRLFAENSATYCASACVLALITLFIVQFI